MKKSNADKITNPKVGDVIKLRSDFWIVYKIETGEKTMWYNMTEKEQIEYSR